MGVGVVSVFRPVSIKHQAKYQRDLQTIVFIFFLFFLFVCLFFVFFCFVLSLFCFLNFNRKLYFYGKI